MSSAARYVLPFAAGAVRLPQRPLEKVWGCTEFGRWAPELGAVERPVGEIVHGDDGSCALLIKTLFTAERLSVQVHPSDAAARAMGLRRGKDEAWAILAAEPGARIGLGLQRTLTGAELRAAVADGTIEELIQWHDCRAGDVFFAPGGAIHAIGSGITLFEIQQNLDLTFRLHDYGRGRPLHVEEALAVADCRRWTPPPPTRLLSPGRELLIDCANFTVERVTVGGSGRIEARPGCPVWIAVVDGCGSFDGTAFGPGDVWRCDTGCEATGEATLLIAYPGGAVAMTAWQPADGPTS